MLVDEHKHAVLGEAAGAGHLASPEEGADSLVPIELVDHSEGAGSHGRPALDGNRVACVHFLETASDFTDLYNLERG